MMAEAHKFTQWGSTCEEMIKTHFPLHRACRDGDTETLGFLLSEGQHGVYIEDGFYGWTPAHWAAYFGKLNCLMRLHEAGVNCDSATIRLNQTALHIAAYAGQSHCAKWLLHCGARIDRQDYLGETPVHKAARTGSMECSSLLVSHGARLYIHNNSGATPAELAENCGFRECAKYMAAAARRQQSDAKGIYENQHHNSLLLPSPEDITATHLIANDGDSHQQNGVGDNHVVDDCDMAEVVDMDTCCQDTGLNAQSCHNGSHAGAVISNGDITVSRAVSANPLAVAGRKRTRETADGVCLKRQRTADLRVIDNKQQLNGFSLQVHANDTTNLSSRDQYLGLLNQSSHFVQQSYDVVSGFRNEHSPHVHNGSFHNQPPSLDPNTVSSSADEYEDSVIIAQGYDSMCCEAMLSESSTYHF